ncbi:MAG: hypothetical protein H5T69_12690 [Chloroflexi bacterium]|nr:hypothetical protein [Chloroflexota bacterium]
MLEIQLFGAGQVRYHGRELPGFPKQQHGRLFCYLLLNRQYPHARERLAAVFWEDQPSVTSRTYLRNALWRLRQALQAIDVPVDNYLLVDDDSVSFLTDSPYTLDVEAFELANVACRDVRGQELNIEQAVALENAVRLYGGELLEDIYDDWCLYERERLRLLHLDALSKLLDYHEHHGNYERGLDYGRIILQRDPTREKVHRRMMRLYWLMGNRAEALAQYKRCLQILREELSIGPMPETEQLYRQMVNNRFDPTKWPLHHDDLLPERIRQEEAVYRLVEHALEKLRHLQAMTDETKAELAHLEHIISEALTGIGQA